MAEIGITKSYIVHFMPNCSVHTVYMHCSVGTFKDDLDGLVVVNVQDYFTIMLLRRLM